VRFIGMVDAHVTDHVGFQFRSDSGRSFQTKSHLLSNQQCVPFSPSYGHFLTETISLQASRMRVFTRGQKSENQKVARRAEK
jgi:hypothetical protein